MNLFSSSTSQNTNPSHTTMSKSHVGTYQHIFMRIQKPNKDTISLIQKKIRFPSGAERKLLYCLWSKSILTWVFSRCVIDESFQLRKPQGRAMVNSKNATEIPMKELRFVQQKYANKKPLTKTAFQMRDDTTFIMGNKLSLAIIINKLKNFKYLSSLSLIINRQYIIGSQIQNPNQPNYRLKSFQGKIYNCKSKINFNLNKIYLTIKFIQMSSHDLSHRMRQLEIQNERLRQTVNSSRHTQNYREQVVPQTKYKKALKEIYDIIQANNQLKLELDKLKTSRHSNQANMADIRKQEIYKVYDSVLHQKNQLATINHEIQIQRQHLQTQVQSLQAQVNILRSQKQYLSQQRQALQSPLAPTQQNSSKSQQSHMQLQQKYKQKQSQYHRTITNYQQHHTTLSNQNKKSQQRIQQLEQKLVLSEKTWRNRLETKQVEIKDIKSQIRHQYQEQINNLRKESNSLKLLNTELMTKLQTVEIDYHQKSEVTEYQIQMLNSIQELRIQMEPLKKEVIELQQLNHFEKEQSERERTTLQMKVYELQSDIERYSMLIKNQDDKLTKLNQTIKKRQDNDQIVRRLQEENKILGGRVIVLQSRDVAIQNRKQGSYRLQQKVLQFQTRIQLLLDQKQNISNIKNVSIHQLITLKSYIVELDHKLKNAISENQYAIKKYKSYKEKYMTSVKQIKQHQVLQNTLKTKIMGYDKLVQRLQSELEKNVNISEMQVININTKTIQQQSSIQVYKQKYQSLKQKLLLQQRYNHQQLQTIKLNYETKIVDLTIKAQQIDNLRSSLALYKQKNEQHMSQLGQKENQILQVRLSIGKQSALKNENDLTFQNLNREIISTLQETITKLQTTIIKLQNDLRTQDDASRKRIVTLQKQLQQIHMEFNKVKLSASTKYSTEKSTQQISSENRKLKNKISELQNEITLLKGLSSQQSRQQSYELEFRISSLEIQKNQLSNRLQTEISHKRRLEKQIQQLLTRNSGLDAQLTQINMQNNRKLQEIKYELNQKQSAIQNLEQEIRRLRNQNRTNLQASTMFNASTVIPKGDHTACENKIQRLQRELLALQSDNEQLRSRLNQHQGQNYGNSSFNYEMETLKHEKEDAKLKIERLEKQLSNLKTNFNSMEQEKYDLQRTINSLKSQISAQKLRIQDDLFEKDRVITQLKSRIQHNDGNSANLTNIRSEFEFSITQKEREHSNMRSKLMSAQSEITQLSISVSNYQKQVSTLRSKLTSLQNLSQQQNQSLRTSQRQLSIMRSKLSTSEQTIQQLSQQSFGFQRQHTNLRSKLSTSQQTIQQLSQQLSTTQRQHANLRSRLFSQQSLIEQLNSTINLYNQQILRLKSNNDSSHSSYTQQMEDLLTQKERTLNKYKEQINIIGYELQEKNQTIVFCNETISRMQRELAEYRQYEEENQMLRVSLKDRDGRISKVRGEIQQWEEENERVKRQASFFKDELQKIKFDMLEKDDEISSLRLQLNNTQVRVTNQISNQYMDELQQKQTQISRLSFQLQSSQQTQTNLQQQLSQSQTALRRLQTQILSLKSQHIQYQEQLTQVTTRLQRKQLQFSQINNEMNSLKFLEQEAAQKNQQINKIRNELTQMRISNSQMQEEIEYKESTILRQNGEIKMVRQELLEKDDWISAKDNQVRMVQSEIMKLRSQIEETQMTVRQRDNNIQRLNAEISRIKQQHKQLEEEIQERQEEWSQIRYQLNQAQSQITLVSDQIQSKDIHIAKLVNESAFLKQQMTRLNEQVLQKNHQINRINQQVFQHKMQFTNQSSQQVQTLSNEIFGLKRQLSSLNHTIQDLQSENRRLKIEIDSSRVKINQQNSIYIYTEQDLMSLREQNNKKYREIMQLQLELSQRNSQIQDVNQNVTRLQQFLAQLEQQQKYNVQRYEQQIETFIQNQRHLRAQMEELNKSNMASTKMVNINSSDDQSQNNEELKFGLHLYTEQTDRLQKIIEDLNEEVSMLKLKLSAMINQEDRAMENLTTMVMTFAEVESLQERIKRKDVQINEVRKSFILAVSSNEDINSQYKFNSSKVVKSVVQTQSRRAVFDQMQSQAGMSIENVKSQKSFNNQEVINQMSEFEIQQNHKQQNLLINQEFTKNFNEQDELLELNQMKEDAVQGEADQEELAQSQVQEVHLGRAQNNAEYQEQVIVQNTQVTVSQQRGRMINITYQGSHVQPVPIHSRAQQRVQQRVSHSQYQPPINAGYVRVSPQTQIPHQQIIQQAPIMIQTGMAQINQRMSLSNMPQNVTQSGNRITINNQIVPGRSVAGSFSINSQNLRY